VVSKRCWCCSADLRLDVDRDIGPVRWIVHITDALKHPEVTPNEIPQPPDGACPAWQ
jgi:hypothetical protein